MTSVPYRCQTVTHAITAVARLAMAFIADIEITDVTFNQEERRGIIIVANHASLLDLIVGLVVFRRWKIAPYIFIRADLLRRPIVGRLYRCIGGIPAGQNNGVAAIRYGSRVLRDGGILMIMPEGRIPKYGEPIRQLRSLMPGVAYLASAIGSPILLTGIVNTAAAWPPGSAFPHFHIKRSQRPTIVISTQWLQVAKRSSKEEIMLAIEHGLKSVLNKIEPGRDKSTVRRLS